LITIFLGINFRHVWQNLSLNLLMATAGKLPRSPSLKVNLFAPTH
jgi:hypothetical protein